jgi:peptidyl-prolyl cis-trans isomerase C
MSLSLLRHMSTTKPTSFALAFSALVLLLADCSSKPAAPRSQPLATLGDEVLVTTADLEAELRNRSPTLPSGQIDAAATNEALHKLIVFALLSREAEREGLAKDDEVQRQLKKSMLNRFVEYDLEQDPRAAPDTDAELMAFYEQHKADYVKPERLRLLIIELKPHAAGTGVPAEVMKANAELKARGASPAAFSALAHQISVDERTRAKGGATDWLTRDEVIAHYGDAVLLAVERLQPNQTSDPIHVKDSWFLVGLGGRQAATSPTFEQLKPALKARSFHDKRAAVAAAREDELRKRSHVQIDDEVLAKVDPLKLGDEKPEPGAVAQ